VTALAVGECEGWVDGCIKVVMTFDKYKARCGTTR